WETPDDRSASAEVRCPICATLFLALPPPPGESGPSFDTIPPTLAPRASDTCVRPDWTPAPAAEPVPGYLVLEALGGGGQGEVAKARQLSLGRIVALKMILGAGHVGPSELARFRTEAESIARLQHPNVVQVYEVGEHRGLPFFSLEFCEGG